jgi:hypothetical protein
LDAHNTSNATNKTAQRGKRQWPNRGLGCQQAHDLLVRSTHSTQRVTCSTHMHRTLGLHDHFVQGKHERSSSDRVTDIVTDTAESLLIVTDSDRLEIVSIELLAPYDASLMFEAVQLAPLCKPFTFDPMLQRLFGLHTRRWLVVVARSVHRHWQMRLSIMCG